MIYDVFPVGPLQCNCIILGCEKTKEGIIIDPGEEADIILKKVKDHGLSIRYLIHTHAHFDHVGATRRVHTELGSSICLHEGDRSLYDLLETQGRLFGFSVEKGLPIQHWIEDEETFRFGNYQLQALHTPGHSPGSTCFSLSGGVVPHLFSGDTLFQNSIGRTDLWGGDSQTLLNSIKGRLFCLPDETEVVPGHGPKTWIGHEKRLNPFVGSGRRF